MARYIDADLLLERIYPYNGVDKSKYAINAKAVFEAIRKSPTADVVEVVRCKDCIWWHERIYPINNYHYGCCDRPLGEYYECDSTFNTTSNDFCSHGERKE